MKQFYMLLAVVVAFGASGHVFGIDTVANESTECVGAASVYSYNDNASYD